MIETSAVRALRAAALHERVLLVEAGPGWGKTTAVRLAFPDAHYVDVPPIERRGALHEALLVASGLSRVDAGRVVARLEKDSAGVNEAVIDTLRVSKMLAIDNVHRLDGDGRALVEALVQWGGVHVVLVGRSMASLPVGTWIARGNAGMPLGPDSLAFHQHDVAEVLDGSARDPDLPGAIVASFGGWPIAATLARSLSHQGYGTSEIVARLREGIAAVAGSVLAEIPAAERALLVEAALMAAHGLQPSRGHLALLRRLGFPESAIGPHEVVVGALLDRAHPKERAEAAARIEFDLDEAPAIFSLLAAEAPASLRERVWELLPALYDRYDGDTLERIAQHRNVDKLTAMTVKCFLCGIRSDFAQAGSIAERIVDAVGKRSHGVALRLARLLLIAGRGATAVGALREMTPKTATDRVLKHGLLGSILDRRKDFLQAIEIASASGSLELIAIASIYAAYGAARAGDLDDAEGFAARGEDAARATGSILQQARALKIRYGVAMLRADLDVAAVHAGRLTTLQGHISDPSERATDLATALEVEVFAGRAARAIAYDDAIRRAGHGWLDMETYVVCRAFMDAWDGRLIEAADRLSAFNRLLDAQNTSRLPIALSAFFAAASGSAERAGAILQLLPEIASSKDPFVRAHHEIAAAFAAVTEAFLGRTAGAARRLRPQAKTRLGGLFLQAARAYAGSRDPSAFAEVMRSGGFDGVARAMDACSFDSARSLLSAAERQILEYLASGLTPARIAELTGRSVYTVRNQRHSLLGKLGASTTVEGIAVARRRGLL